MFSWRVKTYVVHFVFGIVDIDYCNSLLKMGVCDRQYPFGDSCDGQMGMSIDEIKIHGLDSWWSS